MAIISKKYDKLLAILLSWLGFSTILVSCVEYGAPPATYKAKGVVVSQTNNAPIEGIRAVLKAEPNATQGIDTIYTNSKGVFKLKSINDYYYTFYVELTDVDGEKNGSFANKEVEVDFSHVKFKGDDVTDREVEKDLGIIKMEPKK